MDEDAIFITPMILLAGSNARFFRREPADRIGNARVARATLAPLNHHPRTTASLITRETPFAQPE